MRAPWTLRAAVASELERLRAVERVALDFCARCERGEIRSVSTYEGFRAALAGRASEAVRVLEMLCDRTCTTTDARRCRPGETLPIEER